MSETKNETKTVKRIERNTRNTRNTRNKRRKKNTTAPGEYAPKHSGFELSVRKEMRKPFSFKRTMKKYGANEKLYSELMLRKVKIGFVPSEDVVEKIMNSGNSCFDNLRDYLILNDF
jgi:hypothetical protein